MDKTNEIIKAIAEFMKEKYGAAVTEVKGFNFAAVDIDLNTESNSDVYRITVLRHNQKTSKA